MKCAKLHLQERTKARPKSEPRHGKPRRYCQKLLVDPQFEDDAKWPNTIQRYRCAVDQENYDFNGTSKAQNHHDPSDMFLSVQTLQFKGELTQQNKRPRTSFKYKSMAAGQKHRMFVKQVIDESAIQSDADCASELTCYYFDDYAKYFVSNDQSRPPSAKSSIFLSNSDTKQRQNKSVQVDLKTTSEMQRKSKDLMNTNIPTGDVKVLDETITNSDVTKIAFHRRGKRKSITISKVESPATVQVIRVDVVCNYSCSSTTSDYEDNKSQSDNQMSPVERKCKDNYLPKAHYGNKYLLTKSVKALDENVSAGANVTLLCKTFRLADRSRTSADKRSTKTNR